MMVQLIQTKYITDYHGRIAEQSALHKDNSISLT